MKPDLDIMKMYPCIKNKVCKSRHSRIRAQTEHTGAYFCSGDLDLDSMTLIYECGLDKQGDRSKNMSAYPVRQWLAFN